MKKLMIALILISCLLVVSPISLSFAMPVFDIPDSSSWPNAGSCDAHKFATALTNGAAPTCTQPDFSDLTGTNGVCTTSSVCSGYQAAGSYLTGVTADAPLSGSGTSGSHLTVSAATTSDPGSMSAADKTKLDGYPNYGSITSAGVDSSIVTSVTTDTTYTVKTSGGDYTTLPLALAGMANLRSQNLLTIAIDPGIWTITSPIKMGRVTSGTPHILI